MDIQALWDVTLFWLQMDTLRYNETSILFATQQAVTFYKTCILPITVVKTPHHVFSRFDLVKFVQIS
jgi:hypothetical protein